ncbi:MAG: hypothetical protein NWE81_03745 [Candidatus Bathyarchaeota archaeon]|nr:hypothetical protein [Candidatus Bathyarchaeota archaeon]
MRSAIYSLIFVLLLVGAFGTIAWTTLHNVDSPLSYAVTAFLWGITLATLYLAFEKAGWEWWET